MKTLMNGIIAAAVLMSGLFVIVKAEQPKVVTAAHYQPARAAVAVVAIEHNPLPTNPEYINCQRRVAYWYWAGDVHIRPLNQKEKANCGGNQ